LNRFARLIYGSMALLWALTSSTPCTAAQARAPTAEVPPYSVGGRVLGLNSICESCTPEKFTSECIDLLEAPTFDRDGTLLVAGILKGVIWRATPDGKCSIDVQLPPEVKYPAGLRFATDGTLYGVAMGSGLFSVDMSTKKTTLIANGVVLGGLPDGAFHGLNDLVIDHAGGMYMTDAAGSSVLKPIGQLFYRDSAGNISRIISTGLMFPNGIALSPDEKVLYITDWAANRILAVPVISPGVINTAFAYVFAYLNGGHGPDSMTDDADGNIYVAHYGASEIVVFAPNGDYFGAIRLPEGAGTQPSSVAFHDGYLYITEMQKKEIWRVKTKIPGIKLYGGS
jgi:gluconolactonase